MTNRCLLAVLVSLLLLSGCEGGDAATDPVPAPPDDLLTSASRLEQGRALFQEHCALCHGERGDGHGRRRNLSKPPKDLTTAHWQEQATPRAVYRTIRNGVPRSPMAAWAILSENEIWALVAYIASLDGEQGL